METIGCIPTNVGVKDLKFIALTAVYPAFKAWSMNYPLTLDEVQLRRKNWVEMFAVEGYPDVDAVRDECYTAGKNPKLKANAVVHVYLYLTAEIIERVEEHIAAVEESEGQAEEHSMNHRPSKRRKSDSPGKNLYLEESESSGHDVGAKCLSCSSVVLIPRSDLRAKRI